MEEKGDTEKTRLYSNSSLQESEASNRTKLKRFNDMKTDKETKPVQDIQENEKRRAIPKPFCRQKQSVDLGDGCDLIAENTKLINNDIRDAKVTVQLVPDQ